MTDLKGALNYSLIIGTIDAVDETNGTITASYLTSQGQKSFNVPSIYFSANSWIRGCPEEGSLVLIGLSQINQSPEILKVFDVSEKTRLLLNTVTQIGQSDDSTNASKSTPVDKVVTASVPEGGLPFRRLRKGELEASSSGKGFWWLSKYGHTLLKGGLSRLELNPEKNTLEGFSTGFNFQGLDSKITGLEDSSYFGVVRRPVDPRVFLAQRLINTQAISSEVQANQTSTEEVKSKIKDLAALLTKQYEEYKAGCSAMAAKAKEVKSRLGNVAAYTKLIPSLTEPMMTLLTAEDQLLKTARSLRDWGKTYGYSQEDFESSVIDLATDLQNNQAMAGTIKKVTPLIQISSIQTELNSMIENLSGLKPVEIASYNSEAVLQKEQAKQQSTQAQLESTLDRLFKASDTISSDVDAKHLHQSLLLEKNEFCKEFRTTVTWKGSPNTLYEQAYGHVYDKDGLRETSITTGAPLRGRQSFFTDNGNVTLLICDVNGNVTHILAPDATTGYTLTVPKGHGNFFFGKSLSIEVGETCRIHVTERLSILSDKLIYVEGEAIKFKSRTTLDLEGRTVNITALESITEKATTMDRTATASISDAAPSYHHT